MIYFKLYRKFLQQGYTVGKLYYKTDSGDWIYFCDTLEDQVRPAGQKVYGETAIPYGQYQVILTQSMRFHCIMPLVVDVPGFVGVRIHWGNSNLDTSGCILVGENKEKGKVLHSKDTYAKLMMLLNDNPQNNYDLIIC